MPKSVEHFVAYHSVAQMGGPYEPDPKRFSWLSRKSPTFLKKTLGNKVWMIMGTQGGSGTSYELLGYYIPHDIEDSEEEGWYEVVGNEGKIIRPVVLNDYPWFKELLRSQNKFSFGLSRIQQNEVIINFEKLAE